MSTTSDLLTSLTINSAVSAGFIAGYALFRNQPVNTRVYFAKWVKMGAEAGPQAPNPKNRRIGKYINLSLRTYVHVMDWLTASLSMPEEKLIKHAGLDSAIFLRMLLLGIQVFLPMTLFAFAVLVPVNVTDNGLALQQASVSNYTYSSLDTITISNIPNKSSRLWAHVIAAYLFTIWTCFLLFRLYSSLVSLRFSFLAGQDRKQDQFTILCRCVPKHSIEPTEELVDTFFRVNHPDHYLLSRIVYNANKLSKLVAKKEKYKNKVTYLDGVIAKKPTKKRPTMKTGFLGLRGERVDELDYYTEQIEELTEKIRNERARVLSDKKCVMPAAFVSFESRWAAAVCSQTKQSKDSANWLTEWAPEPRDVYWTNLPIPYNQLNSRRLASLALLVVLILFYIFPVTFVQSLANLETLQKSLPFLKPIIKVGLISKVVQGFLPGLALKIFLAVLPYIVWYLAVIEGHVSYSKIEKHACINYLAFLLVIAFLGNVLTSTAIQLLKLFINTPTQIGSLLGTAIPSKSTFFITYIMVDGWTNTAGELFRTLPLIILHFRNATMLRTERDKEEATPIDCINYTVELPRLGLYFLLGFVYSTISPLVLPFILVYLAAAYVVYRNQMINVYEQKYESAGAYWPVMFAYAVIGLLVMHATLIGLMALKHAANSTPFLVPLPICTALFWYYCRARFEESFSCYPLQEAKSKDNMDPLLDEREFLETAYMHPALKTTLTGAGNLDDSDSEEAVDALLHRSPIRPSRHDTSDNWSVSRGSRTGHDNWSNKGRNSPTANTLLSSGSVTPNWSVSRGSRTGHDNWINKGTNSPTANTLLSSGSVTPKQLVNQPTLSSENSPQHGASFSESTLRDRSESTRYMPRNLQMQGSTSPNWQINIPSEKELPRA